MIIAFLCTIGAGFILIGWLKLEEAREINKDLILVVDPCQEIHSLKTVSSRDFKPAYNRKQAKQVVSTCGGE